MHTHLLQMTNIKNIKKITQAKASTFASVCFVAVLVSLLPLAGELIKPNLFQKVRFFFLQDKILIQISYTYTNNNIHTIIHQHTPTMSKPTFNINHFSPQH